jgi:uncharacterized protein YfaS (alpha-2-macroglobulin family)
MMTIKAMVLVAAGLACGGAHALQISSVSPQGEVARVHQVVVKFDEAVVAFGDPKVSAAASLRCSDARASKGSGRWINDREWAFEFENDLPPGVQCSVQASPGLKSPKGAELTGASQFSFSTGGPFVQSIFPNTYQRIDEEQYFLIQLNGPATPESVQANVWCAVQGLGEKVPVRLLDAATRQSLLKVRYLDKAAAAEPLRFVAMACNRQLSAAAQVSLVFGKGVSTPSGVINRVEKRWTYQVREPFEASFSCERESAQAACLPIRPMSLQFNAPVIRRVAAAVRLEGEGKSLQPSFDSEQGDEDSTVTSLSFGGVFPERANYQLVLPKGFSDAAGRTLRNQANYPLKVATSTMPPLAKFAAAPFGIVERLAEPGMPAMLPVTLRSVEPALRVSGFSPGRVSDLHPKTDVEIIEWFRRVQAYDAFWVPRKVALRDGIKTLPKVVYPDYRDRVESRSISLIAGRSGVKALDLPKPEGADSRPFEVVGIPLTPGFHVVEIASQKLGERLLAEGYGSDRTMYVRTSTLVTNLGVHFKLGRENAQAWVTTLDKGAVVPGAQVKVSDCMGRMVASGVTDAQGLVSFDKVPVSPPACTGGTTDDASDEPQDNRLAYFVSARFRGADGVDDMAFTWSDWNRGVEPWRFNLPISRDSEPDQRVHSVLDRTLFRAGETVSMKHLIRLESRQGFSVPKTGPTQMVITHEGSGQEYKQNVSWRATATGGLSAESQFQIPPAAKLGFYSIRLDDQSSGRFRVEEFRLPVLEGRIAPADKAPLVHLKALAVQAQVNYVSGGPAVNLPVRVSALVKPRSISFPDFEEFSFAAPRRGDARREGNEEESQSVPDQRLIADKLPLNLDRQGTGKLTIDPVPDSPQAQDLVLEATYADPNGEVQTLRSQNTLWPAAVVPGLKTEGWVSTAQSMRFRALALDTQGQPQANVPLEVKAVARITTSSRKRMVGGFYTYDNKTEMKDLGTVCSGRSDSRGLLLCETRVAQAGEIELVVSAKDAQGQVAQAASTVWVTRQGELWFGGEDNDRMDVLPEKKSYQPGETARFQVRMPFRFATALVAVEREGVVYSEVVKLNGEDPTINLKVKDSWGPNVYVSVLALRGRLREVPWYSFFTWGFKAPREWWTAFWYEGREYVAPSALVDLSKPAFRLGVAEIRVGSQAHKIDLKLTTDKESYPVRGTAKLSISGTLPNGQPAANAEVAVAAVDQALLELMPNDSWNLLEAMLQRRSWGVETSTAQMEIVGRRHYGRKAVPAGGGGGHSGTRELLDTLLLWNPRVQLDAKGQATLKIPLNDALTSFKLVAVADAGPGLFGTGQTSIRATQDLQIISGLPPLVREADQYRAQITLRNTTGKAMKVEVKPRATLLELPPQTVDIAAGQAREVAWSVTAPAQLAQTRFEAILWEIEARDTLGSARDALKASQRIIPAIALTVQQATLVQLDGSYSLDVASPAEATPGRGGLKLALQPRLAEGLPGVRDWFARYPFVCLEQKTSKSVGLRDAKLWQNVMAQLPTYLDGDGLVSYFPPRDGDANHGSDVLTAYLLAATHEASALYPQFALPDDVLALMEQGLMAFVEGRITRDFWSPRKDLDMRKMAAIEALSRYGKAKGSMLGSITIAPNQWPTHTVIDWLNVLKRVSDVPQREQRLAEANQVLKARLSYQGTKLIFSTESDDYWWWLMQSGDTNTARLLLAVMDDPAWKDDIGRLANGFIARQQGGAWHTTTANLWGGLALEKFSAKFEATPVSGITRATLGGTQAQVDWAKVERVKSTDASGAPHQSTWFGAPAATGQWRNNGMFLPWPSAGAGGTLNVTQQGPGKPWLTVQSVAAMALKAPFSAGYQITKTITPVEQAVKGRYSRGDVLRISLEVKASSDMTWVVITDPVPAGATILGSGLGRDSEIATQGEKREGWAWPAFEERSFESFRSYYEYLPKGSVKMEYTLRLNNVGDFALPPSRVEAMYAPDMFGEAPNARVKVETAP